MEYNQTLRKDTKYACAVYTCLNIFKQDYWIIIEDWLIINILSDK